MLEKGAEISPKVPRERICKGQDSLRSSWGQVSGPTPTPASRFCYTRVPWHLGDGVKQCDMVRRHTQQHLLGPDAALAVHDGQLPRGVLHGVHAILLTQAERHQVLARRGESRESQEDPGVGGSYQPFHRRLNTIPESLPDLGLHQWGPSQGPEFCFHLSHQHLSPASPNTGGSLKALVLSSPL